MRRDLEARDERGPGNLVRSGRTRDDQRAGDEQSSTEKHRRLDGRSTWERLTFFNRYRGGYNASNPTVSPNGRRFTFQLSIDGSTEGEGAGLLVFYLDAYAATSPANR